MYTVYLGNVFYSLIIESPKHKDHMQSYVTFNVVLGNNRMHLTAEKEKPICVELSKVKCRQSLQKVFRALHILYLFVYI